MIHLLAPLGIDPQKLIERLPQESNDAARRAILLSLGEYGPDQVKPRRSRELATMLLDWYRTDPDPGIHSAIDWLLRQRWGLASELEQADRELAGRNAEYRRWSVNEHGDTLAIFDGPVEFLMGSPEQESQRDEAEERHRRTLSHPFAVSTREVTVAQFRHFLADHPEVSVPLLS